jgi:glycosyltransferase involved in cell wall biosynthesis
VPVQKSQVSEKSESSHPSARVALVQDGARGHYGLALALQRCGLLHRVFTDFYASPGSLSASVAKLFQKISPGFGARMVERYSPELDTSVIRQNLRLCLRINSARAKSQSLASYYERASRLTGDWIWSHGLDGANVLMGFIRNIDPELCRKCQGAGVRTIGDQMIAPAATEMQEMQIQQDRFPGWEAGDAESPEFYRAVDTVERATWAALDHAICPSDYVKGEMVRHGFPADRVTVVNYAVDDTVFTPQDRSSKTGPVVVGCVGSIGLRKGAPYFAAVARRLKHLGARFVMIGPESLTEFGKAELRRDVEVIGKVPRSEMPGWLREIDLIFFPTTCEGSAYVLMEAMATGLPIVTSPNSGTVARHGLEALIAPYDDEDQNAAHVERLIRDRDLRLAMGRASAEHYRRFNLASYTRAIGEVVTRVVGDAR